MKCAEFETNEKISEKFSLWPYVHKHWRGMFIFCPQVRSIPYPRKTHWHLILSAQFDVTAVLNYRKRMIFLVWRHIKNFMNTCKLRDVLATRKFLTVDADDYLFPFAPWIQILVL